MSNIKEVANGFFEACETGKGWEVCKDYCTKDATFSSHAEALSEINSIEGYSDWMTGICSTMPDSNYEIKSVTVDIEKEHVSFFAVFSGTHLGEGGPVPPTEKYGEVDYVYALEFSEEKIKHLTKIWNPQHMYKQIGWE
mgnify:FL=1